MTLAIELKMLIGASILGLIQLLSAAAASTMQRGLAWNLSARDKKMPELTGVAGRLDRAFKNFMETFPFFAVSVLCVQLTNHSNSISTFGAQIYCWCRLLYVPIYAVGIPGVRSLVWGLSLIGIVMVVSSLF